MPKQKVIKQANLDHIEKNLNVLSGNIQIISEQVSGVGNEVKVVFSQVEQLSNQFKEFIEQDIKDKALQRALTDIIKIRQKVERQFGHYEKVRRQTLGILQATDISLVKRDTISSCTEELMLSTPGYWLASCLVALAAWINDDKELAERALREALKRDDEKTSLLFSLINCRAGRLNGSLVWLERYFSMQNPHDMERKIIVVLDAYSSGLFGVDSKGVCAAKVKEWINELAEKPGFVEEQQEQWKKKIISQKPVVADSNYYYLNKYSPTWSRMRDVLSGAKLHSNIYSYFKSIMEAQAAGTKQITGKIDDLLDSLVTNYDNEELPLRREEQITQLIINARGDEKLARDWYESEATALEERVNFVQHLTNAAMSPGTSHASYITQKLAIALSRDWIAGAYDDITAENRTKVPLDIEINIDDWTGVTRDGSNESELEQSLDTHVTNKMNAAVASIKPTVFHWIALGVGGVLGIWGLFTIKVLLIVCGAGGVIWYFIGRNQLKKKKQTVVEHYEKFREDAQKIVKANLAEVVDFRREFMEKDAQYVNVLELLHQITPEQYVINRDKNVRQVVVGL